MDHKQMANLTPLNVSIRRSLFWAALALALIAVSAIATTAGAMPL